MDLTLPRRVTPELLDGLPADDPRVRRSRKDLPRIHRDLSAVMSSSFAFGGTNAVLICRRVIG